MGRAQKVHKYTLSIPLIINIYVYFYNIGNHKTYDIVVVEDN